MVSSESHNQCYGSMFPQTLHASSGQPVRGKVFAYQLVRAGGTFLSDQGVSADIQSWDECVECQEFDTCYKLSFGKLLLEAAISEK